MKTGTQLRIQAKLDEARALADNPALVRLREPQALEKMSESGAKFVVGLKDEGLNVSLGAKIEQ